MSDQALKRVDELLTELVEQVETARAVPMSSSIVLPRERVLDLLDELREVLPPEMSEARRLVAMRDQVLLEAHADATSARETASATAEVMLADGRAQADQMVHDAEVQAHEIVEAAKSEHADLVSATGVHAAATVAAAQMKVDADEYGTSVREDADRYHLETIAEAQRYAMDIRNQADGYAVKLTHDSEAYADRTLAELAGTLQRAATTAEQGRVALAARRAQGAGLDSGDPLTDANWQDQAVSA